MNRMNMYNQMYAAGDEVSSGRRPGTVGPNVQRNVPGRMTGVADKVLTGSGRPPVGTMASPRTGLLPTQTLSKMGALSRGGIAGLVAAGGLGLFEIGRQTGFEPEKLGQAAAQVQKSLEEVANEAAEVAKELGQPIKDFVDRVVQGYQSEMQNKTTGMTRAYSPAATGMTRADQTDLLQMRADQTDLLQMAEGGDVSRETIKMEAQKAGIPVNEVDQALSQIEAVEPEMGKLKEIVAMVMQMMQSGASEEEIIMALQQMGLDQEDIQAVFEAVMEAMEVEQAAQSDPIQAEISQMA